MTQMGLPVAMADPAPTRQRSGSDGRMANRWNKRNGNSPKVTLHPGPTGPAGEICGDTGAPSARKLRGGYYTPSEVAAFLAEWAIRGPCAHVLEPSAGDGEIVAAAASRLAGQGHIIAVELHADEAEKARIRGGPQATVMNADFFAWFADTRPDGAFDAVLGNPPFIRYQDFPEEHRRIAFGLMHEEHLHPSRLTNAWLPFVTVATQALRVGGRLALVLPAELLQVSYSAELREYLTRKYSDLTVVTFRKLLFQGIQEETVLLLGIRGDSVGARMSFVELDGLDDLRLDRVNGNGRVNVDLDHAREKWTQYYLSPAELGLIRELEDSDAFTRLGQLAQIDVGIVTGRNQFFVLTEQEAKSRSLLPWCVPLVSRSAQIPGLVLRREEWQEHAEEGGKCFLLQLGNVDRDGLPESALDYVTLGEEAGYHRQYKCRLRLPRWWNVPSVWTPDAFLLRQIHDGPRLVRNCAGATCTDTIHRARMVGKMDSNWLAAASVNSLTYAFAEIRGRSYGGGVLELEPTEAESLPFPKPTGHPLPTDELDSWARRKGIHHVLGDIDRLVLKPAGLNTSEMQVLRGIWRKLYQRRIARKRR